MSSLFAWPVLVVLSAGVGTLSLITYLLQYRDNPGATWFVLTLVGQATFCFAYGIGLTVWDPGVRVWFEIVAFIGLTWLGVPFLAFALAYTGRGQLVRSLWFRILLAFPVVATVLLPLNGWHGLFWTDFEIDPVFGVATASYSFQPIAFVGVLGAGTVVGIATVVLLDTVLSYGPLYRREALAVALSPVPPIAGMFPWLFGFGPAPQLNTVALGLLPHVLLDAYAFVGSGMFEFYPATSRAAERSSIDDLQHPVLVLEDAGRIVDLNDAAESVLGLDRETVVTRELGAVLDGRLTLADLEDSSSSERITVQNDGRRLEYRVQPSPLRDSSGHHVGYTVQFQDVTREVQQRERLGVLNRVLRHNLRNDLSVILLYLENAAHQTDDERIADTLRKAERKGTELVGTAETAREIEETISAGTEAATPFDLERLLEKIARETEAAYEGASISVDCDAGTVAISERVLASIVGELVENAVIHTERESPSVTIEATREDGRLTIDVVDDGPGIPDHELASLRAGDESSLEHGSGLGLWLVKWGSIQLGGDVAFDATADGTTATLTVPVAPDT